jgi:hypothetical protein
MESLNRLTVVSTDFQSLEDSTANAGGMDTANSLNLASPLYQLTDGVDPNK